MTDTTLTDVPEETGVHDEATAAVAEVESQLLVVVRNKINDRFTTQSQAAESLHTFQPRISTIMTGDNPLSLASLMRVAYRCGVHIKVELTDDYHDKTFPPLPGEDNVTETSEDNVTETSEDNVTETSEDNVTETSEDNVNA